MRIKISAVTEAGKVGGKLAKDFFKEEYMLNSKIGKYSQEMLIHFVIKPTSSWRDCLFVCLFVCLTTHQPYLVISI